MSSRIIKPKVKVKVDVSQYVNMETGESLGDELNGKGVVTTITEDGKYVVVNSDDFTIVDSQAMRYLTECLTRSELGSLGIMTSDLKTPLNLVFNYSVPHTNETLQAALDIASRSTFTALIRKLMVLGVLYQIKGNIMGKVRVVYMMNPLFARKRAKMDTVIYDVFKKLTPLK
jgi:hypothetical protein